jgi:hypothetical protein
MQFAQTKLQFIDKLVKFVLLEDCLVCAQYFLADLCKHADCFLVA